MRGISRYGRASQGVKVMNIREDDLVSAVALVAQSTTDIGAPAGAADELPEPEAAAGDGVTISEAPPLGENDGPVGSNGGGAPEGS